MAKLIKKDDLLKRLSLYIHFDRDGAKVIHVEDLLKVLKEIDVWHIKESEA